MKKLLLLFAVTTLTLPLAAQSKFGIKAGAMLQSESIGIAGIERNNSGFTGGIYWYSELLFLPVYFQPELMYNAFGYKRYLCGANDLPMCKEHSYDHQQFTNSTLSLPVLLGIRLAFLRVNAGPEFRLATFRKEENLALHMSKYGFIAGGGLTLGSMDIDLRYRVNLDDSALHYNYDDFKERFTFKDKGFTTLTIGFKFGK